jgi:hypothetical protein
LTVKSACGYRAGPFACTFTTFVNHTRSLQCLTLIVSKDLVSLLKAE